MIPDVCTHMLYKAADTVRERTVLELRLFQPTWIGCANEETSASSRYRNRDWGLTAWIRKKNRHSKPCQPLINLINIDEVD